jgi:hypothetical protein
MSIKFNYTKLKENRIRMVQEVARATQEGQHYLSPRLNSSGQSIWPTMLETAARDQDEHRLAYELESGGFIKELEGKATPSGGYTIAHVPHTAAETLADGQFTRFYIAAVCAGAIEDGSNRVTAYRAKSRANPRADSASKEGKIYNAKELLAQVRSRDSSLNCELLRPNSGFAVS